MAVTNGVDTHSTNGTYDRNGVNGGGVNGQTKLANGHHSGAVETNGYRSEELANAQKRMPIAICGMGMRLPGGIRNGEDLFDFLHNKGDARKEVPLDRFNVKAYYDPGGKPGTIVSEHGYFLEDDLALFDTTMFNMSEAEAAQVDPAQRLLLEVAREAFESAGESDFRGKNIGTYVGDFTTTWEELKGVDLMDHEPHQLLGTLDFVLANRLAFEYDLRGPSMTTKTACSATAVALNEAVQAIWCGSIPSALVAGANLIITPRGSIVMSSQMTLSPLGSCKTFDANADGFARGESVGALYIKRLDHALRDGNPIRAVIRSSGSNADGTKPVFTSPSSDVQETLIRQTYAAAGLDLDSTGVVECHGTGTAVGDPLEVEAVASCFGHRKDGTYITSVKPNVGHGEGASVLASVFKAIVSFENNVILPNIKFEKPNPKIRWENGRIRVPTTAVPWPKAMAKRMSINSFGIGGSNVHLVLDSADSYLSDFSLPRSIAAPLRSSLLLFSGNNPAAISNMLESHKKYHQTSPDSLADMAYTLASRRERLKLRSFSVVHDSIFSDLPPPVADQGIRKISFVFTGQGAQWIGMGRELMHEEVVFLNSIRAMDNALKETLLAPPAWTLEDMLLHEEDPSVFSAVDRAQPLCTAVQVALVDLLAQWNVFPSAVVGHSSGEIAAAYAAGVFTRDEAIIAAFYRGAIYDLNKTAGAMAAIGLGASIVQPYLSEEVVVGCENSSSSVTITGDVKAVESAMAKLRDDFPDALVRRLRVPMAYHSHHMRVAGDAYVSQLEPYLHPQEPSVPFFSSVSGHRIQRAAELGPTYWRANMEQPVLFRDAVLQLLAHFGSSQPAHVEVGPAAALAGPLRQICKEALTSAHYVSSLVRHEHATKSFLVSMGTLFNLGIEVKVPEAPARKAVANLPTYPWQYGSRYWAETRVMKNWRHREHPTHELLGQRTIESSEVEPSWRNLLRIGDSPWLQDHCVGTDIVFPAAGYIAIAGAAAMQLNGGESYTVRDVHITVAMVLQENKSVEVVTTLRPRRMTTSLESKFYEFSICSHSNGVWTRHCWGTVAAGRYLSRRSPVQTIQNFSREVSSKRWYRTMAEVGLPYGPRFAGLDNITCSPRERVASTWVTDRQNTKDSSYPLHPATLDMILQSWSVASVKGEYRDLSRLFLPTFIEELFVGHEAQGKSMHINTVASGLSSTARGHSIGVVDGGTEPAFVLRGFKGTPMNGVVHDRPQAKVQQINWIRNFECARLEELMIPARDSTRELATFERMFVLIVLELHERVASTVCSQPHFEKYRSWFAGQYDTITQKLEMPQVPDVADLVTMTSEQRQAEMNIIRESSLAADEVPIEVGWLAYKHMIDIIEGRTDYLDLLLQDDVLQRFYAWLNDLNDLENLFRTLGSNRPQIRILEIGAGTGGLTAKALEGLQSSYGERLYQSYTITDISAGFFTQCRERFKDYTSIEYQTLDISRDPLEQGFEAGAYDLILASNVIHATPFITETLKNCRTLLRPDGYLFLQELSPLSQYSNYVMGLFSGWWLGSEDNRPDRPCIAPEEWDVRLRQAGFEGVRAVNFDNVLPHYYSANMVSRVALPNQTPKPVTLLTNSSGLSDFSSAIKQMLQEAGHDVAHCVWGEGELDESHDVISFIDLERATPLLFDIDETNLARFLAMAEGVSANTMLWLTPPSQMLCNNPQHGLILGASRTIRQELAMDFATLELDNYTDSSSANAVVNVLAHVTRSRAAGTADLDPEAEFAWTNGAMYVSRLHWSSMDTTLAATTSSGESKALTIGQRGLLQTLRWESRPSRTLQPNEVRIKVSSVGMNFLDVAIAMNIVDTPEVLGEDGYNALGAEGVGIVTEAGADVDRTRLAIGDRVITLGIDCTMYATDAYRPQQCCVRIPDQLKTEDAAGMAVPYVTVLYSFLDKAQLKKGQTVLIHSAAGGVGIAAIHVARWLGAEIYVTVGSKRKADFLVENLGVSRDRIFHSRDDSFRSDVLDATDGRGVDVVLNSLSGELLHATWECVAPSGCMLEIGKRDFLGRAELAMHLFEANRAYFGIDLARLAVTNTEDVLRLLSQTIELYEQGHIHPLLPTTVFEADQVREAFSYMQQGLHIGRVVVQMPEEGQDNLAVTPVVPKPSFRPDVTYLLVGGLGGLGRSIVSWMAAAGAMDLIVLSRSAGQSASDKLFTADVKEATGCTVHCVAGDVTDASCVKQVIASATRPIAGVMQLAMVLKDTAFLNMDYGSWTDVMRPKVQGTWNLHELLLGQPLDFFVLFSSTTGIAGNPGQANYASANTYLDAFARYRHGLQLPASVFDIGAIGDVGFVAVSPALLRRIESSLGIPILEKEFLAGLQLGVARSHKEHISGAVEPAAVESYQNKGHIIMLNDMQRSIVDPETQVVWKRDPRMSIFRNIEDFNQADNELQSVNIRRYIASLTSEPQKLEDPSVAATLSQELGKRVYSFISPSESVEVDLSQTLNSLGVDSLVTIEIRNWWKQAFETEVSVLELKDGGSIEQLGQLAVQRLVDKHGNSK